MSSGPALTYLVLRCADLERSRCFYEALGLTLIAEQHGAGPRHYTCHLGEVVFELYPRGSRQGSDVRLGIRVADLAATVDAVREAGGEVVRADADEALVRDPDGHSIHLAQHGKCARRDDIVAGCADVAGARHERG